MHLLVILLLLGAHVSALRMTSWVGDDVNVSG
jgi:hypothetical protein